jgi:hypothetical protein
MVLLLINLIFWKKFVSSQTSFAGHIRTGAGAAAGQAPLRSCGISSALP